MKKIKYFLLLGGLAFMLSVQAQESIPPADEISPGDGSGVGCPSGWTSAPSLTKGEKDNSWTTLCPSSVINGRCCTRL